MALFTSEFRSFIGRLLTDLTSKYDIDLDFSYVSKTVKRLVAINATADDGRYRPGSHTSRMVI